MSETLESIGKKLDDAAGETKNLHATIGGLDDRIGGLAERQDKLEVVLAGDLTAQPPVRGLIHFTEDLQRRTEDLEDHRATVMKWGGKVLFVVVIGALGVVGSLIVQAVVFFQGGHVTP